MDINCKGLQTNMLPNVGSEEDLINKNLTSRQIEFCKSDPAKWKLTLQDVKTTPIEPKTERGSTVG